ncbi:autotransporter domain-containing protein [Termitidicoccus mucosus]|uniref:Autotransporter domain-containing protein n=1 Tax=Termitidicoccus mucosus TaxID=1184151 RepID=A0A178IG92_9BACT|nr:hypothetical protein AW736_15085 [Opitutaceae bacterium TSB47]
MKFLAKSLPLALALLSAAALRAQLTPIPDHFTDWTGAVDNNFLNPANWRTDNGSPVVLEGPDIAIRLPGDPAIPNKRITYNHTDAGDKRLTLYSIQTGASKAYTLEFAGNENGWLEINPVGRGFVFNGVIGAEMGSSYRITRPDTTGNATTRLATNVILHPYTRLTLANSSAGVRLAASGLGLGVFTLLGNAEMDVSQSGNVPFVWMQSGSVTTTNASRTATVEIGALLRTDPGTVIYVGARNVSINASLGTGQTSEMSGLFYGDNTGNATCDVYGDITHMTGIVNFTGDGRAAFRLRGSRAQYIVDGVHNGNIDIWSASTLGGSGIINGNVTVEGGGQLTPGRRNTAADAPLTINGNVNLYGNLSFDLVTPTVYDRLAISGTLTVHSPAHPTAPGDANLVVGLADTFPLVTGTYALMTVTAPVTETVTDGVITGTAGALDGNFADTHVSFPSSTSIRYSWAWDVQNETIGGVLHEKRTLLVSFEQLPFASSPQLAGKYLAAAEKVDEVYALAANNGDVYQTFEPLFDALNRQPSIMLYRDVLDQLTPSNYQSWFPSAVVRANSMVQSMEDRMYQDAAFKRKKRSWQTFLEGYRQEASHARDALAAYSNYGVIASVAGVDYAFGENAILGAFAAYEQTEFDLDTAGGSCDVDSYTFGLNARYNKGRFQFNLAGFYGADDYKSSRSVALTRLATWADADTGGTRLGAAASLAFTLNLPWFEVTPIVGAQWLDWKADAFQERNAGEASLSVYEQKETSLQGKLGVRVARSFSTKAGMLRPFLHYAWLAEFESDTRVLSADLFGGRIDIESPGINANGWRLDAGIDWSATRKLRIDLRYHSEYRGAANENVGIRGGVTYAF